MFVNDCYPLEEMNNSANVKIEMTAEEIFKEIEALPRSERERLVQRMRESADIPQDFIDALDDFNPQRFVSLKRRRTRELQVPRSREILAELLQT